MGRSLRAAVELTHEWFDANSGWAPPDEGTLEEWLAEGLCRCPDECQVAPAEVCPHGLVSWWLVLNALDRPDRSGQMAPATLVPRRDRLDPGRSDFVAILDAHQAAVLAGEPGYIDPGSGLFALTARTLWDRGSCCESGCRHCPYREPA